MNDHLTKERNGLPLLPEAGSPRPLIFMNQSQPNTQGLSLKSFLEAAAAKKGKERNLPLMNALRALTRNEPFHAAFSTLPQVAKWYALERTRKEPEIFFAERLTGVGCAGAKALMELLNQYGGLAGLVPQEAPPVVPHNSFILVVDTCPYDIPAANNRSNAEEQILTNLHNLLWWAQNQGIPFMAIASRTLDRLRLDDLAGRSLILCGMYGDLGIMRSAVTLARANYEVTILKDAVLWDKIGNDSNVDETVAVHQAFTGEIFPQLSLQYPWIRAELRYYE